ncbi:hypothetical protein B0H14DRAFT_1064218 [Mycena olivaceomarginata]|nr:hypothetical protein B0H14DRAFT_1064218 [Mycena olivaceomarginata]
MAASLSVSRCHSAQRMARNRQLQMYLSLRMRRVRHPQSTKLQRAAVDALAPIRADASESCGVNATCSGDAYAIQSFLPPCCLLYIVFSVRGTRPRSCSYCRVLTPHLLCEAAADTHHRHASLGSFRLLHAVSPLASTTEVLVPIHPRATKYGRPGILNGCARTRERDVYVECISVAALDGEARLLVCHSVPTLRRVALLADTGVRTERQTSRQRKNAALYQFYSL